MWNKNMDCRQPDIKTYKWVVKKRVGGSHKHQNGMLSPAGSGKKVIQKMNNANNAMEQK
jgi:hypothetical protein